MKYRTIVILLCIVCLSSAMSTSAVTRVERQLAPNEFRIGWGDMLYEKKMYHNSNSTNNYHYTGHVFAEYHHYFLPWFSLGIAADYEHVWWDVIRDGMTPLPTPDKNHFFYNASLLPSMRFTYCHKPHVNLYSALLFGLTVNGGTEIDMYGRKTAFSPAWGITLMGITVGGQHCFASVEIGGLHALSGRNFIYMIGSRKIALSLGFNF